MRLAACFALISMTLCADEVSIKTTTDQYGYCTDNFYDPVTETTQPLPENPAQAVARQKLAALDVAKRQLRLEDGTRWTIPEAFIYNVDDWKTGDSVQLSHPQSYDGYTFNLANLSRSNEGIRVSIIEDEQRNKFIFARLVRSSNADTHKIYLSDETVWDYNPDRSFQPIFAAVPPDAPVTYAVNTGPDAFDRPVLLVSFSGFPPDRIAVRPTNP